MAFFANKNKADRLLFLEWLQQYYPQLHSKFAGNVDTAVIRNGRMTINNNGAISYEDRLSMINALKEYYSVTLRQTTVSTKK